jgi:hypothetical protein
VNWTVRARRRRLDTVERLVREQMMNEDTVDNLDGARHPTTDAAADGPVVGFELTLTRNRPAECTLFLVETAGERWGDAWITAEEGAFIDLDASR